MSFAMPGTPRIKKTPIPIMLRRDKSLIILLRCHPYLAEFAHSCIHPFLLTVPRDLHQQYYPQTARRIRIICRILITEIPLRLPYTQLFSVAVSVRPQKPIHTALTAALSVPAAPCKPGGNATISSSTVANILTC